MAGDSLADLILDVRLRADGMEKRLDDLNRVGLTQADVDTGRTLATNLETQNAEQESLKGALKAKTNELNGTMQEARDWRSRMTKRIKVALEDNPALWVEFGIKASR